MTEDSADVGGRPRSYAPILEAAVNEFASRGRDGFNIERVASAAGVNKALVYRYFGDRTRLIDSALEFVLAERMKAAESSPTDLRDLLAVWLERMKSEKRYMTILMREALDCDTPGAALGDMRREYYQSHVELVRRLQAQGAINEHVEPAMLLVAIMSMLAFPSLLPKVASLASGVEPDSPEFTTKWLDTLMSLVNGGTGPRK